MWGGDGFSFATYRALEANISTLEVEVRTQVFILACPAPEDLEKLRERCPSTSAGVGMETL